MLTRNKSIKRLFLVCGILISALIIAAFSSNEVGAMAILLAVIFLLYQSIVEKISNSTSAETVLCDGRFYVITALLAYTVIPPIYGILSFNENGGVRMLMIYRASTYTMGELLQTVGMSTLFFFGLFLGFCSREYVHSSWQKSDFDPNSDDVAEKKYLHKLIGWVIVCGVSTFFYLLPFFRGGFQVILNGGTISDVESVRGSSFLWKIIDFFFAPEMMVASTVAVIYYSYKSSISKRKKQIILFAVVVFQVIISYLTTRRARAIAILICALIIFIRWYKEKHGRLPIAQLVTVGGIFLFMYFLEVIMNLTEVKGSFANYLSLFDGVSAYDSLLQATREGPNITMLGNIVYGIFRHIPFLGKYIVSILGFHTDASPLYQWMADRYSLYQAGNALAYTPQLEAFLCGGFFGCFFFGIVYGFVFSKERKNLANLFIAAIAFSVARGNIQILLQLMWIFGITGYYFYDRLLFERISVARSQHFK